MINYFSKKPLPAVAKDGCKYVTDEFYNTLTAASGALFFFLATFFLVRSAILAHDQFKIIGFSIYGVCATLLFAMSATHHAVDGSPHTNKLLLRLDFCAIYLMIAGTCTPLCLLLIRNSFGWIVLGLFWFFALAGICIALFFPLMPRWVTICLYVGISWLGLIFLKPIYQSIGSGLTLMIVGGVFYTVGAALYFLQIPNFKPGRFGCHEVWHLFVLAGAISHFAMMWFYLR